LDLACWPNRASFTQIQVAPDTLFLMPNGFLETSIKRTFYMRKFVRGNRLRQLVHVYVFPARDVASIPCESQNMVSCAMPRSCY